MIKKSHYHILQKRLLIAFTGRNVFIQMKKKELNLEQKKEKKER